jgi:hypothetical protein
MAGRQQQQHLALPGGGSSTSEVPLPLPLKGLPVAGEGSAADKPERQPQGRRGRGEHSLLLSAMEVVVERWPARSPPSSSSSSTSPSSSAAADAVRRQRHGRVRALGAVPSCAAPLLPKREATEAAALEVLLAASDALGQRAHEAGLRARELQVLPKMHH